MTIKLNPDKQWYTSKEVAALLDVHQSTVNKMFNNGTLKGVKFSPSELGHWKVSRDDLDVYINGGE